MKRLWAWVTAVWVSLSRLPLWQYESYFVVSARRLAAVTLLPAPHSIPDTAAANQLVLVTVHCSLEFVLVSWEMWRVFSALLLICGRCRDKWLLGPFCCGSFFFSAMHSYWCVPLLLNSHLVLFLVYPLNRELLSIYSLISKSVSLDGCVVRAAYKIDKLILEKGTPIHAVALKVFTLVLTRAYT